MRHVCMTVNNRAMASSPVGRFRAYTLRITFATILLAEGEPITYVASQLGHSKPTTTLRYYAKWLLGTTTSTLSIEPGKRNLRRALRRCSKVKTMHSATKPRHHASLWEISK